MDDQMDGWIGRFMDGRLDGCLDAWSDKWMVRYMDGHMDGWIFWARLDGCQWHHPW